MAEFTTVYETFANTARRWPTRPVFNVLQETADIYAITAGEHTYARVLERVDSIAQELATAGLREGSRILLLLENRPDFFVYWLAMNQLGISVVPVNPDLRAAELAYLLGHAEPSLAVSIASHVPLLQSAARAAGIDLPVIEPGMPIPVISKNRMVAAVEQNPAAREAAVLYTSGTTGQAKGCVLSNTYFLLAGQWYASAGGVCALTTDHERMITPLPVFHMNAMAYSFMAMVTVGGCLICIDRFHPHSWWHSVKSSGATCLHYLGVMPSMLMGAAEQADDTAHQVRFGFGAGVDSTLHQAFEQRFGFPLVEAWAMTETSADLPTRSTLSSLMTTAKRCLPIHPVSCWCAVQVRHRATVFSVNTIKINAPPTTPGAADGFTPAILSRRMSRAKWCLSIERRTSYVAVERTLPQSKWNRY